MILITSLSNQIGLVAARTLLAHGVNVRGVTNDFDRAKSIAEAGGEVVEGDLSNELLRKRVLTDVSTLILVSKNGPAQVQHEILISEDAERFGINHLVKISSIDARPDATAPIARGHYEIELFLSGLKLVVTTIKPNYLMQNLLKISHTIKSSDIFSLPLGKSKIAMINADDIGEIAANVVVSSPKISKSYSITGPKSLDCHQIAEEMSRAFGRNIRYIRNSHEEFKHLLANTLDSQWEVEATSQWYEDITTGAYDKISDDSYTLLGRKPRTFEDFLKAHRASFCL